MSFMFKRANILTVTKVEVAEYAEEDAGIAYLSVAFFGSDRYLEFQLSLDEVERIDSDGNDEGYCVLNWPHATPEEAQGVINLGCLEPDLLRRRALLYLS